jgi:hypothetical protein
MNVRMFWDYHSKGKVDQFSTSIIGEAAGQAYSS